MLVGRDRELATLAAALERARTASGALFLLAGEPGIGKTRLASEVSDLAAREGFHSAWGRCWEAGGAPAFWPWREALEKSGVSFPDASAIHANAPAEARFALFREVASLLEKHAASQPLLIVLEDLHAADLSTLLLLEFVAVQSRTLPLVVVGTYRELEASLRPEYGDALARSGRIGRVLQLARLKRDEVAILVHDAIADADERLAATVYETTLGNPLFVDEIVRDVRASGVTTGAIPLGVREIIRQRLGLVSAEARDVLTRGAVLGVEFDAADVERMSPGATRVLDAATKSGLVTVRDGHLRFSHALYREALYHDLDVDRRRALHREAARALALSGSSVAETAHHLLESGPEVVTEAIDHAIRAAGLALDEFAFEDALELLERARAGIPDTAEAIVLRCRVLIALGEARIRSGDASGREQCDEAARIARQIKDFELLSRAGLAYGAVFVMGGVDPVLVGMLEEGLAGLKGESPLRARTMARLAAARQPSVPSERARDIDLALEAIELARRVADRRELADVLHSASGALYGAADPRVRLGISSEQERLAEELNDATRLILARARIAMDHSELGDFSAYLRVAERYEKLANRIGPAANPWRPALMRSMCALVVDRFEESERWQKESARIESTNPRARRAQAFHRLCFFRAMERHEELRATIPELRGLWLEMPYGKALADSRVASQLARIGAEDEVARVMSQLPDIAFEEEINSWSLAEAVWLTGNRDHARRLYGMVAATATSWRTYWLDTEIVEAPGHRIAAYLAAALDDWEGAERHFAQALAEIEAVGRRSMAARMKFELGDLLVRKNRDLDRARALLGEARTEAASVGLPELVALIERRHAPSQRRRPQKLEMSAEGEYFAVSAGGNVLRFKASRGMRYLAHLVERPGVEIHVLELAGATQGVDRGDAGELLDGHAFREYRARLEALREAAETAEALGNSRAAARAREEMEAIATEIARATGRGGRPRRGESAVDRARSAVQRRIKDAIDRIAERDGDLGRWLKRSVSTGNYCCFRPDA